MYLDSCLWALKIKCDAGQFFIDIFMHNAIIIGNEKGNGGYYLCRCIKIYANSISIFLVCNVKHFNQNTLKGGEVLHLHLFP